jgi:ComF family protein
MKTFFSVFTRHTTKVINHLLPTTCLLCGCTLKGELLCSGCELDLPHLEQAGMLCVQCSLPLAGIGPYCGHCLHRPPAFSYSVIPFSYEHPLDFLIHGFKYRGRLAYGRALAQALANHIHHHYLDIEQPLPELIIPVPLHWIRRWRRGFNQADMIGQMLSRKLQIPLQTRLCRRRLSTPSQKGLSRAERQKNLRRAFVLTQEMANLEGKCVALLDDVVTTTATARELSELLIKGGAREVHVWALARTLDKKI